jgi:hypothetical protein
MQDATVDTTLLLINDISREEVEVHTPVHVTTMIDAQNIEEIEVQTPGHVYVSPPTQLVLTTAEQTPLFVQVQAPLLSRPESMTPPPRRPTARRKTLAGITGFAGFPLQRSSPRLKAKRRAMPIAKLAEKVLCERLGIVAQGEAVTEEAIAKFVQMFQGRLPDIAIAALRALFRLDCDFATAVEDALVEHGGAGAIDQAADTAAEAGGQA